MASKYDAYWGGQRERIRAELQLAASGVPAVVSVPDLTRQGARQSWHGTAEVRGQELTHSSGAHATSLGKEIAASGICKPWPHSTFRFMIDAAGRVLTITMAPEPDSGDPDSKTGPPPKVPGRIFMSYRREETAYPVGWLYDRLAGYFGKDQVFKDVDSIEPGDDFVEVITAAVGSCDVLLAVIGARWLTITGHDGRRRLDDPGDFVRLEVEAALARNVRVIPVLVDGARVPRAAELPESLVKLTRRHALELDPNRFDADSHRLLEVLDRTLAESQERSEQLHRGPIVR